MDIQKLKEFGVYIGYQEELGFVYKVEDTMYALKGGLITQIKEELLV